jgi:hypothetical protein
MAMFEQATIGELDVDEIIGQGIGPYTPGKKIFVDSVNGSDGNTGKKPRSALKTLAAGYAKTTSNKNDIVYLIGGASAYTVTAAFTWSNYFTHLIGIGSKLHNGGRCRIAPSVSMSPVFTVSGRGCIFNNIHWQNPTITLNTNLLTLSVTYEGNACNEFSNCDIEGPLAAAQAAAAFVTLNIANHSQDNTFRKSRIGQWTVQASLASGSMIKFGGDNSITTFEDCTVLGNSTADWVPVDSAANLGGDGAFVQFIKSRFLSLKSGLTSTKVFGSPTAGSFVLLQDCVRVGFTDWGANAALIYSTMPTAVEAGGLGIVPTV